MDKDKQVMNLKCPSCGKEMELTILGDIYWCPNRNPICPQKVIMVDNFDYQAANAKQVRKR